MSEIAEDSMEKQDVEKSLSETYKKRNRPGRSSRRRKAKLRAIQEAEERLLAGEDLVSNAVRGTPSDRARAWPGVMQRRSKEWSAKDEESLVGQLGYLPGNAVAVAARASQFPSLGIQPDVPLVLQLYPIAIRDAYSGGRTDGRKFKSRKRIPSRSDNCDVLSISDDQNGEDELIEPFPTMYWLTSPLLRTLTSKLELGNTHNVKQMETRLAADENALAFMKIAHEEYGKARWNLLTEEDQALMERRHWKEALLTGVAGIRKHAAVKCLHANLAHYLSTGPGSVENLVGKWVFEQVCKLIVAGSEDQSDA
jgi:hypothetical protein